VFRMSDVVSREAYCVLRIAYCVNEGKTWRRENGGRNLGKRGGLDKGGIRLRRDELGLIGFVLNNVRCSLFPPLADSLA